MHFKYLEFCNRFLTEYRNLVKLKTVNTHHNRLLSVQFKEFLYHLEDGFWLVWYSSCSKSSFEIVESIRRVVSSCRETRESGERGGHGCLVGVVSKGGSRAKG